MMNSLIEECSYKERLNIFCGTYNVNANYPTEDLKAWLFADSKPVDVYAIGFQEVVDLNTSSFLLQSDWLERESAWLQAINDILISSENNKNYILVDKIRMFGLFLLIYVNGDDLKNSIYELFKAEVATGIMDTVGNKGSIAISMKLHETRICFVCSHFAADLDKVMKRNTDYRSTRQRLKFVYNANLDYYDLEMHDLIFWFGDLNYRIDSISLVKAISLIESNELDELITYDQLINQKKQLNIFEDYMEGEIKFRPTYKYIVGHDKYAKQELVKSSSTANDLGCDRIAYTDRVLWRTNNKLNVKLVRYSCINTITISDHKPVFALFDTEIKRIDLEKYNKKYDEWLKDTDRRINDEMPHIKASHHEVKFTNLLYYDEKSFEFTVQNKGIRLTNVGIRFYDPSALDTNLEDQESTRVSNLKSKQWIQINPHHKERLLPEGEFKIELRTRINNENLKRLNQTPKLDDFLIISCLNGNDVFFTVSIEYQRTIIGYSLKALGYLNKDEKFTEKNLDLLAQIEGEINDFETRLNTAWSANLKRTFNENEQMKLMSAVKQEPNAFLVTNKLDLYKKCLSQLKKDIVYQDKYFNNDLSIQYEFFMNYLIKRCKETSSNEAQTKLDLNMTLEEQKNLILTCLSTNDFEKIESNWLDIDVLIEVLKDLLYSLPCSLIPIRYIDYLMYADNDYKEALLILNYIPKSQLKLFELIIKFLQLYKQFRKEFDADFNYIIANAIFKIKLDIKIFTSPLSSNNNNPNDIDHFKRQTADQFLNLFIQNHLSQ